MIIKHRGLLPTLGKLGKDASAAKSLGITHLNELSLFISSEDNVFFMIQAADESVKKNYKPALFHAN